MLYCRELLGSVCVTVEGQSEFQSFGDNPEVPSDEECTVPDIAASAIAEKLAEYAMAADIEQAGTAEPAQPERLQRPQRAYDPERDGPAITYANFNELAATHTEPLLRFLTARVGRDLAEDYVQETFCRAWRAVAHGTLVGSRYVSPWLYRIADNVSRDYFRKAGLIAWLSLDAPAERSDGSPGDTFGSMLATERSGDDFPDIVDAKIAVGLVLRWLPPHLRAHILYDNDGTSVDERAELIGVERHTMGIQARCARRAFRNGFLHYQRYGRVPDQAPREAYGVNVPLPYIPAARRLLGYRPFNGD